jgi:hypothetical protein
VRPGKIPPAQHGYALAATELLKKRFPRPANAVIQLLGKKEERVVLSAKSFD